MECATVRLVLATLATGMACGSQFSLAQETVIPEAFPASRYLAVWENSPFELDAPPPPPPEEVEQVSFAEDLSLAGVLVIGKAVTLTILDKATGEYMRVTNQANSSGIRLVEISRDPDPKLVTATIARGDELATIGYEPQLLAAAPKLPGARQSRVSRPGLPPSRAVPRTSTSSPSPVSRPHSSPAASAANRPFQPKTVASPLQRSIKTSQSFGGARPPTTGTRPGPTATERRRVTIPTVRTRTPNAAP